MNHLKQFALVIAAICLVAAAPNVSRADTFQFNVGNGPPITGTAGINQSGYLGPYGSIYISAIGNTLTFELKATVGTDSDRPIKYSDLGFNVLAGVNGPNMTGATAQYSGDGNAFVNTTLSQNTNLDGFGDFSLVAESPNGTTKSFSNLIFKVTVPNEVTLTLSDFEQLNINDYYFATHVYLTGDDGTNYTGFAASDGFTGGPPVPVPSSFVMLASMLVPGLGYLGFRRRNVLVAA